MTTVVVEFWRASRWLKHPAAYTIGAPTFTVLGAATTVLAPSLLDPVQFGRFVLLASIFQYVADFDLGLSRLTDRALALPTAERADCDVSELLWTRLWLAAAVWLVVVIGCRFLPGGWGQLVLLASSGGLVFMLSNGPVAVYRAGGRVGEFTFAALSMQFGMGLPRLAGLLIAGVKGCFVALAGWYLLTTALFAASSVPRRTVPPTAARMLRLIATGVPLFIFGTLWSVYLFASRWIASLLMTPVQTGLFGFGVTLVGVGVGVIGTIAQVHYPKHLAKTGSGHLRRELERLHALIVLAVLAGVWACRVLVPHVFPRFADAAPAAAALLLSGIPLALCSWLVPLAVATAARPWRDALVVFGLGLMVLTGGMVLGHAAGNITALAWGCLPSAALLLSLLGQRIVRAELLTQFDLRRLLLHTVLAISAGGVEWLMLFR